VRSHPRLSLAKTLPAPKTERFDTANMEARLGVNQKASADGTILDASTHGHVRRIHGGQGSDVCLGKGSPHSSVGDFVTARASNDNEVQSTSIKEPQQIQKEPVGAYKILQLSVTA